MEALSVSRQRAEEEKLEALAALRQVLGCRVQGAGCRVQGVGCRV